MALKYESIVPWGRSYDEYVEMFSLTKADLDRSILCCADGPAGFNSIMAKNGSKIISVDPLYHFSGKEIEKRIADTYQDVINRTGQNKDKFLWTKIKNVEKLGKIRMSAMKEFLGDYEKGKIEKRYIPAELPVLPFENKQFDLSLCSHFLFLYTDNLSLEFHRLSIQEMCRVSNEVRIFPLLDINAVTSPYLVKVKDELEEQGYSVNEVLVNYEFQRGGNRMLKISI